MLEICVPKSKIETVIVRNGKYYVEYFSRRNIVYTNPPKTVTELIEKTPTKEHFVGKYGNDMEFEFVLYRNYRLKED